MIRTKPVKLRWTLACGTKHYVTLSSKRESINRIDWDGRVVNGEGGKAGLITQ